MFACAHKQACDGAMKRVGGRKRTSQPQETMRKQAEKQQRQSKGSTQHAGRAKEEKGEGEKEARRKPTLASSRGKAQRRTSIKAKTPDGAGARRLKQESTRGRNKTRS